jgi:hypothetical protein
VLRPSVYTCLLLFHPQDKAGDEESPGEQPIGLEGGDVDGHGLCRGGAEVLREQLRGVGEAGDAAAGRGKQDPKFSRSLTMRRIAVENGP